MEPFVTTDELVAETEARHEYEFFEPEYGKEGSREEDAFNCSKCDDPIGKTGVGGITPR